MGYGIFSGVTAQERQIGEIVTSIQSDLGDEYLKIPTTDELKIQSTEEIKANNEFYNLLQPFPKAINEIDDVRIIKSNITVFKTIDGSEINTEHYPSDEEIELLKKRMGAFETRKKLEFVRYFPGVGKIVSAEQYATTPDNVKDGKKFNEVSKYSRSLFLIDEEDSSKIYFFRTKDFFPFEITEETNLNFVPWYCQKFDNFYFPVSYTGKAEFRGVKGYLISGTDNDRKTYGNKNYPKCLSYFLDTTNLRIYPIYLQGEDTTTLKRQSLIKSIAFTNANSSSLGNKGVGLLFYNNIDTYRDNQFNNYMAYFSPDEFKNSFTLVEKKTVENKLSSSYYCFTAQPDNSCYLKDPNNSDNLFYYDYIISSTENSMGFILLSLRESTDTFPSIVNFSRGRQSTLTYLEGNNSNYSPAPSMAYIDASKMTPDGKYYKVTIENLMPNFPPYLASRSDSLGSSYSYRMIYHPLADKVVYLPVGDDNNLETDEPKFVGFICSQISKGKEMEIKQRKFSFSNNDTGYSAYMYDTKNDIEVGVNVRDLHLTASFYNQKDVRFYKSHNIDNNTTASLENIYTDFPYVIYGIDNFFNNLGRYMVYQSYLDENEKPIKEIDWEIGYALPSFILDNNSCGINAFIKIK